MQNDSCESMFGDVAVITATEFEQQVKTYLESAGGELSEFRSEHRECIEGNDGVYEIDVTVRFRALAVDFLVLVECKHHKNPIKREHVQVLRDKILGLGAQKGILFSTSNFQKGAIQYAIEHGIALIRIAPGETSYFAKSANRTKLPDWIPAYVGWLIAKEDKASTGVAYWLVCAKNPDPLRTFLFESASTGGPSKTPVSAQSV